MPARTRVLLSWSSGKDSAWALHELRRGADLEVAGLVSTVSAAHERIAIHGVRRQLLDAQAEAAGLPLRTVSLPSPCSNAEYEAAMTAALSAARDEGIDAVAFGDLFLADVRRYREAMLPRLGLRGLFPLWGRPTDALAREMLSGGVRAHVTCVDPRQIPGRLAGRVWDEAFLAELPPEADPCGERGEFHTFVSAGPMLGTPISVRPGPVVERDGFVFADLLPDVP